MQFILSFYICNDKVISCVIGPFPIAVVLFSYVVLGNNFYLICFITIPILVQLRIHDTG